MSVILEITLKVKEENRPKAAAVYGKYRAEFLTQTPGAIDKQLLVRADDVQVVKKFQSIVHAEDYLKSNLFVNKVVPELRPLLEGPPDIRVYEIVA